MPEVLAKDDLTATELRALARREPDGRVRVRLLLIAHLADGWEREAAAAAVGLARQASYDWPKRYNSDGVEGLRDRPRPGRRRHLEASRTEAFKERITNGADLARDGVVVFRGADARRILKEEFGADYSLSGTYRLLHELKLSWLRPRPRHPGSEARRQAEFRKRFQHNLSESPRASSPVSESRFGFRTRPGSARRTT
jgi:transposase